MTLTVWDGDGNAATDSVTLTVRDVTPPTLTILSPPEGLVVNGSLVITANATDNVGVTRVKLFVDSVSIQDDFAPPYEFVLPAGRLSPGNHTIQVCANDAALNGACQIHHVTAVGSGGGGLLPDAVLFGGLMLILLAAIGAVALIILRRRRPRMPVSMPTPAPVSEESHTATAPTEGPPLERPASDPAFDEPLQ